MKRYEDEDSGNILRASAVMSIAFGVAFLVFEAIFYFTFQGAVNSQLWPLDKSFFYYTPILLVATAIFCFVSLTQTYYEIDGAVFIHSKMACIIFLFSTLSL